MKKIGKPRKTIGILRKTIGRPRKTIGIPRKFIGIFKKSKAIPKKTIGILRKSTGAKGILRTTRGMHRSVETTILRECYMKGV